MAFGSPLAFRKSGDSGAFADWSEVRLITILSSAVDADLTDYPIHLDLSDLGSSFFDDVKSDGSDIRITLADGVTEVPREIVEIDTTGDTGRLYFKGDISSSTDTVFKIYYGNASAAEPAAAAANGSEAVWSNGYEAVWHLTETPSSGSYANLDSTGNGYGLIASGTTPTLNTSGKFGNAVTFSAGRLSSSNNWTPTQPMTNEAWIYVTGSGNMTVLGNGVDSSFNRRNLLMYQGTKVQHTEAGGDVRSNTTLSKNVWNYVATTKASGGGSGSVTLYNNGVEPSVTLFTTPSTGNGTSNPLRLGRNNANSESFVGSMSEARLSNVERSADWISTQYTNHNDTSSFYTITADSSLAYTAPLDQVSGAAAAFSTRRLSTLYSGDCMRVRRASDDLEVDIGFTAAGDLDTTALAAHCSGTNGFVSKWYDQSGNAEDATQTVFSRQPKIYDSSTTHYTNGTNTKPVIHFDATDTYFDLPDVSGGTTFVSTFIVYEDDSTASWCAPAASGYSGGGLYHGHSNNSQIFNTANTISAVRSGENRLNGTDIGDGLSTARPTNFSLLTSITNAAVNTATYDLILIGTDFHSSDRSINGSMGEIIFYFNDTNSTNRDTIEGNLNSYWGLF